MDRGYRSGYSDGYQAGFKDLNDQVSKDATKSRDYASADRAYVETYGALEDYKDGYRQGFEAGYDAGYERRAFDSSIPTSLQRRGTNTNSQAPVSGSQSGVRDLPPNSILRIELQSEISTDVSQRGDPFQARVVEPGELAGSTVQGHLALVKRPGRVKGSGELQLAFDRLVLTDGRTIPFDAQVIEVLEQGIRQTGTVDPEGGVKGKDSTKDDVTKVGAGTAVGAIIGAIAGGGKGAAIGAVIGGGASTGGVLASRGKDIRLHPGQQLRIQTARETKF
jgi:type IV secretion system protein VirB10